MKVAYVEDVDGTSFPSSWPESLRACLDPVPCDTCRSPATRFWFVMPRPWVRLRTPALYARCPAHYFGNIEFASRFTTISLDEYLVAKVHES